VQEEKDAREGKKQKGSVGIKWGPDGSLGAWRKPREAKGSGKKKGEWVQG